MPDYRLQLFRGNLPGITQVDFMVAAFISNVQRIALFLHELMHRFHGLRLIIIRADVHALNAQSLVNGQKLHLREVRFFLASSFLDCPVKVCPGHKIWQPDDGDKAEILFVGIVNALNPVLLVLCQEKVQVKNDLAPM